MWINQRSTLNCDPPFLQFLRPPLLQAAFTCWSDHHYYLSKTLFHFTTDLPFGCSAYTVGQKGCYPEVN